MSDQPRQPEQPESEPAQPPQYQPPQYQPPQNQPPQYQPPQYQAPEGSPSSGQASGSQPPYQPPQTGPYQSQPQPGPYPPQPGPQQPAYGPPESPYGPPGQPLVPPPPARKRRRPLVAFGSILVAVLVIVVIRVAYSSLFGLSATKVGECLQFNQDQSRSSLKQASCDSGNMKLFGIASTVSGCADVPGTEYGIQVSAGKIFCFGSKDLDPATAVNAAKVGDCLQISGDKANKAASCSSGTYPVVAIKKDVLKATGDNFDTACGDVSGAENAYVWSFGTEEGKTTIAKYDRVYCLGGTK